MLPAGYFILSIVSEAFGEAKPTLKTVCFGAPG
jgi:hypothetical protein